MFLFCASCGKTLPIQFINSNVFCSILYGQIAITQLQIYLHLGRILGDNYLGGLQNDFFGNKCVAALSSEKKMKLCAT